MEVSAIVLAAGKGTRMKSDLPKCANIIIDKPMVEYVVDTLRDLRVKKIVTVVGYGKEKIMECLGEKVEYAVQEQQLGTAHAVMQAKKLLEGINGITIIAIGDMPFIKKETFYSLLINHLQECAKLTVLTVDHPQPYGYGRIIRDSNNQVIDIVEEKDCTKEQTTIREINSSVYAVDTELLFECLSEIKNNNSQKEYYLTDLVKVFKSKNYKVCGFKANDYKELSGINTKSQLAELEEQYQKEIIEKHLFNGVTIHNKNTVVIGKGVKIKPGVTIYPNTIITGNSEIFDDAVIGPMTVIDNSVIMNGATVMNSIVKNALVDENQKVGPFVEIKDNKI